MKLNGRIISVLAGLSLSALAVGLTVNYDSLLAERSKMNAQTLKEILVSKGERIIFEAIEFDKGGKIGVISAYVGTFKESEDKYWCAAFIDGKYRWKTIDGEYTESIELFDKSSKEFEDLRKKTMNIAALYNESSTIDNTKEPTLKLVSCNSPDTIDWSQNAKPYVFQDTGIVGYTNGGIVDKAGYSKNKSDSWYDFPFLFDDTQNIYGELLEDLVDGEFIPQIQFPLPLELFEDYSTKRRVYG